MAVDDALARAVDGVADGAVVNWAALQGLARSDDERAELRWLEVLADVSSLHRPALDTPVETDQSATTHPAWGEAQEASPSIWGRYRLGPKLGAGSFGSVYGAWDSELERNVAIKILHEQVDDEPLKQRLLREGRALARVKHANVVQVLGIETHGNRVGLCMELVSGETLGGMLRTHGVMGHREAVVVGEEVCRALAAVHAAGYVHRDVKAQNVMRDSTGNIVLMDFGTGHDMVRDRRPQDAVGTPVYMAPELLDGAPATVQSDIYAVGVLLYHLVSGKYPVEGGTVAEVIEGHRAGRRRPLIERRPDLPMSFVTLVSRALATNPAERWAGAGAMLEALEGTKPEWLAWARAAGRIAAGVAGGVVGLTWLGAVTSRYFDVALGRESFVNEGPGDWLYWGAVSVVAPAILVLIANFGFSFLRVAVRLALRLSSRARRLADRLLATMHRFGLDDIEGVSALALMASAVVIAGACWFVRADLAALWRIDPNIASAPVETLTYLSPAFAGNHETYRLVFEWACIVIVAVWWSTYRFAARRGQRLNAGMLAAAAASLLLTILLLDFPYRLLYQADFDTVEWDGRRCYVLGERGDDNLVFCPDLEPPRNRAVRKDAAELKPLGTKENAFTHPSIFPTERR